MWDNKISDIRTSLLKSLLVLTDEKLNQKPSKNEWSIAQIALHLAAAETRFMTLAMESAENPEAEEGALVDLSIFEDPTKKMIAPIEPPSDFRTKKQVMNALSKSRTLTDSFLKKYTSADLEGKMMNHHRFGIMPIWQVFEMLGKHEERHIHQIEQCKKKLFS